MFRLLRPKQWSKNLLVFAALLFTGGFKDANAELRTWLAFAGMCLLSSSVYVVNDLIDRERDRAHPTKRNRPVASGAVSPSAAVATFAILLLAGLGIGLYLGLAPLGAMAAYLALQAAYNLGLKHQAVADVFTIASGFVLRAVLGAVAINVVISGWLLLCTGALALTLGFAKRRQELVNVGEGATRESLRSYTRPALDALVLVNAASALVCYAVYSLQSETAHRFPGLAVTTFFVSYGVCRYLLRVFGENEGGEPADLLFHDPHLLFAILGYLAAALVAVSGVQLPVIGR